MGLENDEFVSDLTDGIADNTRRGSGLYHFIKLIRDDMTPHDRHTIFIIDNEFGDHTTPSLAPSLQAAF